MGSRFGTCSPFFNINQAPFLRLAQLALVASCVRCLRPQLLLLPLPTSHMRIHLANEKSTSLGSRQVSFPAGTRAELLALLLNLPFEILGDLLQVLQVHSDEISGSARVYWASIEYSCKRIPEIPSRITGA